MVEASTMLWCNRNSYGDRLTQPMSGGFHGDDGRDFLSERELQTELVVLPGALIGFRV